MEKKIIVIKDKMKSFFSGEGRMMSVTGLVGREDKLGEVFKEGDRVSVTGVSKGKGFAGVVKRHGFSGGPRTHGQSDRERAPGSIGSTTTPGRVLKGKRMAGRLGGCRATVKNLRIAEIDAEKNILYVTGCVPGVKKGLLEVKKRLAV